MNTSTALILFVGAVLAAAYLACADGDSGEIPTALPAAQTEGGMTLRAALAARRSVRSFLPDALTDEQIAQLCWAAQGVTDPQRGFRTAPSAGATFPLELYVVTASGVGRYDPAAHGMVAHADGDRRARLRAAALNQQFIEQAPATFVIAGVVARTARRYGDRAARYVRMEVGHAAQNLLLQAVGMELGAVPIGAFDDDAVVDALDLPAAHAPMYVIPVGRPR
ncbi:MAG: SagB/ThcOx family dehydrogenase [Planctomycetota bacterium]|jgi:SagB-type dehydrogenase family enzyme